jgi:hypothetical protein
MLKFGGSCANAFVCRMREKRHPKRGIYWRLGFPRLYSCNDATLAAMLPARLFRSGT